MPNIKNSRVDFAAIYWKRNIWLVKIPDLMLVPNIENSRFDPSVHIENSRFDLGVSIENSRFDPGVNVEDSIFP